MICLREYEILILADPHLTEEEMDQLLGRLKDGMQALGIETIKVDNWGRRRLAYELKKQREGSYAVFEVRAEQPAIKEFWRQLKLNESVMRFATTRLPRRRPTPEASPAPEPTQVAVEETTY